MPLERLYLDLQARLVPDGCRDDRQDAGVIGVAKPANRIEIEPLGDAGGGFPRRFRQCRSQFQLRCRQEPGDAELGCRAGQSGEEQGRSLGGRQPGQSRAVAIEQFEPAIRAAIGIDRHVSSAQLLDVTVDRTDRDLEFGGKRLRRHAATRL